MRQTGCIEPQLPRHSTEATSAGLPSPNTPLLVETCRRITVLGRFSSTMGGLSYSLSKRHLPGVCRSHFLTCHAAALHGRAGRSHGNLRRPNDLRRKPKTEALAPVPDRHEALAPVPDRQPSEPA
jgi:hypothetical protein